MKHLFVCLSFFALFSVVNAQNQLPEGFDQLSKDEKIDWLVKNMSIEEKVAHLNTSPVGKKSYRQNYDKNYELVGFVSCDGPRGAKIGGQGLVNFPAAINLGASWDTSMARKIGEAYTKQLRYFKSNQLFSPGLNIIRHPQCGRNNEYYSEDPILTGKLGAANIMGIQAGGFIATPKHYVANNFEIGRFQIDVTVPERVLREVYLPAFQLAVTEGRPWSLMTSYNSVNGHFVSANKHLLDILYDEWNFDGYIVSDYGAEFESTASAMNAGTHLEMPGWKWYTADSIQQALESGALSQQRFDELFRKVLEIKLSDWLVHPDTMQDEPFDYEAQFALSRQLATESAVLLKNQNNVLPLSDNMHLALIGPFANSDLIKGVQGSSSNRTKRFITLKQAFEEAGMQVDFHEGVSVLPPEKPLITDIACKAEYYDNMYLKGSPVIARDESNIQKISFSGAGAAEVADGVIDKAFHFSGQSRLKIGASPEIAENEDFSWSLWVYLPDQFPNKDGGLFSGYFRRWNEFTLTPEYFEISLFKQRKRLQLNAKLSDQLWSNVTLVRKDGVMFMYVNGQLIDQGEFPYDLPAAELAIGGSNVTDNNSNCLIDEVQWFNRALTNDEITAIFQQQSVTDGKVLHQPCDDVASVQQGQERYDGIAYPNTLSSRWTFELTPDQSGKYFFDVFSNGGVRLYVDGRKMYDQWQEAWVEGQHRRAWVDVTQGKPHKIVVEFGNWYAHNRGKGGFIKVGYGYLGEEAYDAIEEAKLLAANADAAIVAVGVPATPYQGESNDLDHFYLAGFQDELVQAVAEVNPKTIVVLFTAGGVDMRSWETRVPTILEMFHPGEDGGYAVADLVLGKKNPSGKLPVTYYQSVDELPIEVVTEKYEASVAGLGYRLLDKTGEKPLFAFGHGLSYTSFEMKKLKVLWDDTQKIVSVEVKNTGNRSGAEVVQVYVSSPSNGVEQPVKELAGFAKVWLDAGDSKVVDIQLSDIAINYFDETTGDWKMADGEYLIQVGNASDNILLTKKVKL